MNFFVRTMTSPCDPFIFEPLVDQKERHKKARLESASFLAKRATSVEDALDTLDEDFPISKRICTFSVFLQTQLYAVMANGSRTLVDRVIDEKRRTNQIRVVQLGTCTSQSGLCLTEDLIKYLKKLTVVDPKKQRIISTSNSVIFYLNSCLLSKFLRQAHASCYSNVLYE